MPLVGALVTAFVPKAPGSALPKQVALAGLPGDAAIGIAIAVQFNAGDGMQLTETHTWIKAFGVHYALGVDGLGLLMILLTVALVPIVFVASWHEADDSNPAAFFAWALALEAFALCVFAATDVFLFYVVFEATLIPAYFLIGGFGREGRGLRRAQVPDVPARRRTGAARRGHRPLRRVRRRGHAVLPHLRPAAARHEHDLPSAGSSSASWSPSS